MPGKTKTSAHFHTLRFFGGRGWMSRAAHLKKPRRGFFARRTIRRADAVRIHPPGEFSLVAKQKTSVISTLVLLVGAGGFEPPKLKAADLQSVPIGHSGTRPYSLFVSFAGRLVYSIMQKGFCQLFFYLFLQMRFPCRETAEQRREKPCSHAGTAKSEKKASRKKLIGKLQEKLGTICEKCKTFCLYIEKRSKA